MSANDPFFLSLLLSVALRCLHKWLSEHRSFGELRINVDSQSTCIVFRIIKFIWNSHLYGDEVHTTDAHRPPVYPYHGHACREIYALLPFTASSLNIVSQFTLMGRFKAIIHRGATVLRSALGRPLRKDVSVSVYRSTQKNAPKMDATHNTEDVCESDTRCERERAAVD